jgi:hypothetical protein
VLVFSDCVASDSPVAECECVASCIYPLCICLALIHSKGGQGSSEEDEDQDSGWEDG